MSELRSKLKHGDVKLIAQLAGVERSTADKTLRGTRNNRKVKEAARLLFESRDEIAKKLSTK